MNNFTKSARGMLIISLLAFAPMAFAIDDPQTRNGLQQVLDIFYSPLAAIFYSAILGVAGLSWGFGWAPWQKILQVLAGIAVIILSPGIVSLFI